MTQITKPQARLAGQAGCITIALCLVMLPLATALPAPVPQEVPNVASTIAPSGTTTPGPSTVSASASSSPSASRGLPMQTGYIVLIGLGSIVTVATLVFLSRWAITRKLKMWWRPESVTATSTSTDPAPPYAATLAEQRAARRAARNMGGLARSDSGRTHHTLPEYTKDAGDEEVVLGDRDSRITTTTESDAFRYPPPARNEWSSETQTPENLTTSARLSTAAERTDNGTGGAAVGRQVGTGDLGEVPPYEPQDHAPDSAQGAADRNSVPTPFDMIVSSPDQSPSWWASWKPNKNSNTSPV